jgi:hypothetical protein
MALTLTSTDASRPGWLAGRCLRRHRLLVRILVQGAVRENI